MKVKTSKSIHMGGSKAMPPGEYEVEDSKAKVWIAKGYAEEIKPAKKKEEKAPRKTKENKSQAKSK